MSQLDYCQKYAKNNRLIINFQHLDIIIFNG